MKAYLSFKDFCRLSWQVCLKCDLTPPRYSKLTELYFSPEPQPLLMEGVDARAWIDKYYMAYQFREEPVCYVYLSRRHIDEERQAISEVYAERGLILNLPREIETSFTRAEQAMAIERTAYVWHWP